MADTENDKPHPVGVKEGDAELQEQLDTLLTTLNKAESGLQAVEGSTGKAAPPSAPDDMPEGDTITPAIDAMLTEARAAGSKESTTARPAPTAALVAATTNTDAVKPSPEEDILGEDLANQIQELLDSTAESMGGGVKLAAREETIKSSTPPVAPASPSAPEPPAISPMPIKPALVTRVENAQIKALDTTLAQEADDAIAGDFETPQDVILTAAATASAAQEQAQANAHAQAPQANTAAGERPAKNLSDVEEEPALEGDFESPAELVAKATVKAAAPPPGFTAGAADVAKELDSQPEKNAGATPRAREPVAPRRPRTFALSPAALAKGLFVLLNRPLANASVQTRNLVGWVGLLTLFNATLLIAGSMVMRTGHDDSAASTTPTKHATPAKESSEEGEAHPKPAHKKPAAGHH
ncbi:MAG: hypothetical protein K8S99_11770 [Planctomycetes bacterium]|nr:hypothetical protein [Planctomycetota bacterium]